MRPLNEIEAMAEAATPAPWWHDLNRTSVECRHLWGHKQNSISPYISLDADADFIANARTDVPELVDAVRTRDTRIGELTTAIREVLYREAEGWEGPGTEQLIDPIRRVLLSDQTTKEP